ncbi:MAG: DUF748 domain-containing protein [Nitrospirales bacterium]
MALFRNSKRLLILLVCIFLLYAFVGFVVIPWVAKSKIPTLLSEQLGRPASVGDIAFNPFTFSLTVQDLAVQEDDQVPLFGFQQFFVNFQALSLFQKAYAFEEIKLVLPYGLVKVRADGSLNVADLGPTNAPAEESVAEEPTQESSEDARLPAIDIHHIGIEQGMVEFHDESRNTPFSADIVPINITLNNFTTRGDAENPYAVTAEFGDGETLEWEGTLVLEPFSSSGKVSLTGLSLQTPWQYLQDQLRFEIQKGLLSVSTEYQLTTRDEALETILTEGEVHVSDLSMAAKGNTNTVMAIPSLDVEGVTVDLSQQQVTIPFVRSRDANFATWLTQKGTVNYQELFAPVDARASSDTSEVAAESTADAKPWIVEVHDFILENYTVDFEDRTLETPAQINLRGVDLQVKKLKTTFEDPFDVTLVMKLNDTGNLEMNGSIGVEPMIVDLELKLAELALAPFFPYVSPHVQFDLVDGALDLEGKMTYHASPTTTPLLHYDGHIALNQLVASDPELMEEFLKVQSLAVNDVALDVEPTTVSIGEIKLAEPFIKATVTTDGTMNLSRVFSPPGTEQISEEEPSQAELSEPAKDPIPVKIDHVNLVNARAQFADLSLEPHVLTGIQDLTGTIAGLSSAQVAKADVDLTGKVDQYAPFEVKGKINPLSRDAYSDVTLLFKNVDLTAVSPYSGKYAGHPITKGKLSLDLQYKIAEHILEGENKILVDQLTMGSETGSPDATSLPVPLALALLKDRHGKIDIDLPVRGNLDEPDFSYGGLVLQALVNILTKAVTSPFNLIGGLMGSGGDDLKFVEFAVASQEINEKEQEKLDALAQALEERPALRLEVTGTADPDVDRQALAEAKLMTQLQMRRGQSGSSQESSSPQSVDVLLDPEEQRRLIRDLYVQKFGEAAAVKLETPSSAPIETVSEPKSPSTIMDADNQPNTDPEMAQGEPWEKMKRQLLDEMTIPDSEVRLLAQHRAQVIRDHLIQQGKVPEERVFLIEVQINAIADEGHVRSPLALTAG